MQVIMASPEPSLDEVLNEVRRATRGMARLQLALLPEGRTGFTMRWGFKSCVPRARAWYQVTVEWTPGGGWAIEPDRDAPEEAISPPVTFTPAQRIATRLLGMCLGSARLYYQHLLLMSKNIKFAQYYAKWEQEWIQDGTAPVELQRMRATIRLARAAHTENAGPGAGGGAG